MKTIVPTETFYIRARTNQTHKDVGRSLGLDEIANEDQLHRDMKTSDGIWTLWDCGRRDFETAKALVMDFLNSGYEVYLYGQLVDGLPIRFEDDEMRMARKNVRPSRLEVSKSKSLLAAEARLLQLKTKRRKSSSV